MCIRDSLTVVYQHILVVDMVAGEQKPHRGGEWQSAVTPVGGEAAQPDKPAVVHDEIVGTEGKTGLIERYFSLMPEGDTTLQDIELSACLLYTS